MLRPIEIKEHLNLEHTIVLKQSMCMLIAKRPTSLSEKFINFFAIMKKQTSTTHKNNSSNEK